MQKSRWPFGHRDFDFGMLRISNRLLALLRLCLHVLTAIRMTVGGFVARYKDRHGGLSLRLMGAGELTTDTHGSPLNWLSPVVPRSYFCAFCAFCGLLASRLSPLASRLLPLPSSLSPKGVGQGGRPLPQMNKYSGTHFLAGCAGGEERVRVRCVVDHLLAATAF